MGRAHSAGEAEPGPGGREVIPQQISHSQGLLQSREGLTCQQVSPSIHQLPHSRPVPLLQLLGQGAWPVSRDVT